MKCKFEYLVIAAFRYEYDLRIRQINAANVSTGVIIRCPELWYIYVLMYWYLSKQGAITWRVICVVVLPWPYNALFHRLSVCLKNVHTL